MGDLYDTREFPGLPENLQSVFSRYGWNFLHLKLISSCSKSVYQFSSVAVNDGIGISIDVYSFSSVTARKIASGQSDLICQCCCFVTVFFFFLHYCTAAAHISLLCCGDVVQKRHQQPMHTSDEHHHHFKVVRRRGNGMHAH